MKPIKPFDCALSFAVAALVVAGVARSAEPTTPDPRRAAAEACRADAARLCADVPPGGGGRRACLRNHASELSTGCKDGLARLDAMQKDRAPK